MKTRDKIKAKGLELFNQQGVRNVTLRLVAQELGKSYGNITYHFKTKSDLVNELYRDMVRELGEITQGLARSQKALLDKMLEAPAAAFEVSLRYLFLFKDYVEILRTFPEVAEAVQKSNELRKKAYVGLLVGMVQDGILRQDLEESDLAYILELSGAMRTQFMMQVEPEGDTFSEAKTRFSDYTNRLIKPYLSPRGLAAYAAWQANQVT